MSRMNYRERQLYLLGLAVKMAIENIAGDENNATFEHWQWLVSLMERTAAAHPETQNIASRIRFLLDDPRIPF